MKFLPLFLSLALLGCGNSSNGQSGESDDFYGAYVAKQFDIDCRRAKAPTPNAAKELAQLCTCSTGKLRSTVHYGDSDDVVNGKIRQIAEACQKKVYPNG